jgi:hypothetical protein
MQQDVRNGRDCVAKVFLDHFGTFATQSEVNLPDGATVMWLIGVFDWLRFEARRRLSESLSLAVSGRARGNATA